jgi:biopolymer transport protein ExbD
MGGRFSDATQDEVMSEINMTPLVDVMLVLLVIFLITLPVVQHAVELKLPTAKAAALPDLTKPVSLSIDANGVYAIGTSKLSSLAALEERLTQLGPDYDKVQLQLRADKAVPYDYVAQAMALAQRLGFKQLGFVTEAPAK